MNRFRITAVGLGSALLVAAACSHAVRAPMPNDRTVAAGTIGSEMTDFELIVDSASSPSGPVPGPFAIRGTNIRYDTDAAVLVADITATNLSDEMYLLPVRLEFAELLPPAVKVLDADTDEHAAGAMIEFLFLEKDLRWAPGETSLPRTVHFAIAADAPVEFAARIHVGRTAGK